MSLGWESNPGIPTYTIYVPLPKFLRFVTSAFGGEPRRMLSAIQLFGKRCNCHLQGECVVVRRFWKLYIEQALGGELYLVVLIGGEDTTKCNSPSTACHM
jgi:hypothetical protein